MKIIPVCLLYHHHHLCLCCIAYQTQGVGVGMVRVQNCIRTASAAAGGQRKAHWWWCLVRCCKPGSVQKSMHQFQFIDIWQNEPLFGKILISAPISGLLCTAVCVFFCYAMYSVSIHMPQFHYKIYINRVCSRAITIFLKI